MRFPILVLCLLPLSASAADPQPGPDIEIHNPDGSPIEWQSPGEWLQQLQGLPPVQEPEEDKAREVPEPAGHYHAIHEGREMPTCEWGYASCPWGTGRGR